MSEIVPSSTTCGISNWKRRQHGADCRAGASYPMVCYASSGCDRPVVPAWRFIIRVFLGLATKNGGSRVPRHAGCITLDRRGQVDEGRPNDKQPQNACCGRWTRKNGYCCDCGTVCWTARTTRCPATPIPLPASLQASCGQRAKLQHFFLEQGTKP